MGAATRAMDSLPDAGALVKLAAKDVPSFLVNLPARIESVARSSSTALSTAVTTFSAAPSSFIDFAGYCRSPVTPHEPWTFPSGVMAPMFIVTRPTTFPESSRSSPLHVPINQSFEPGWASKVPALSPTITNTIVNATRALSIDPSRSWRRSAPRNDNLVKPL
jgi:hypothetical protein